MGETADHGMIHLASRYSASETLARLESLLKAKGLTIFCRVDHSGEAEKVGLKMNPTQLVIFGSPRPARRLWWRRPRWRLISL